MSDITKIKIDNERERSYKDFPANREFKKRAEDDNPGGGWPSDLPKPSADGYGYTESGEQTVIVDNERITTVSGEYGALGQFATPFDIVDGAYTVIFNGTEYNLNPSFAGMAGLCLGDRLRFGLDFSRYPFFIISYGQETQLYTESAGDYEITIKMKSDTIHKIDEKYLPASGDGEKFVVTFTVDDNNIATPDKTDNEINEALFKGLRIVGLIPSILGSNELQYTDGFVGTGCYTFAIVSTRNNYYYVSQILYDVDENDNSSYRYVEKTYSLTERG